MEQHMEALQRANEVRSARAELKRAVKGGQVKVAEVLLGDIPNWLAGMTVEDLCVAIHGLWRSQYNHFIRQSGIGRTASVGNLTIRQRRALASALSDWEIPDCERRRIRQRQRRQGVI